MAYIKHCYKESRVNICRIHRQCVVHGNNSVNASCFTVMTTIIQLDLATHVTLKSDCCNQSVCPLPLCEVAHKIRIHVKNNCFSYLLETKCQYLLIQVYFTLSYPASLCCFISALNFLVSFSKNSCSHSAFRCS